MGEHALPLRISRLDLVPRGALAPHPRALARSAGLGFATVAMLLNLSVIPQRRRGIGNPDSFQIARAQTRFEFRAPRYFVFDPEFLVVQEKDFTHCRPFHASLRRGGMPSVSEIGPSYRERSEQAQLEIFRGSHAVRDDVAERHARARECLGDNFVTESLDCRNTALSANSQVGAKVLVIHVLINVHNNTPVREALAVLPDSSLNRSSVSAKESNSV